MQKAKNYLVLLVIMSMTFIGYSLPLRADTVSDIVKEGKITIAIQTQGPPYSFINKDGERAGFAVELVRMMAEDMKVELVFKDYEWKGLIPALLSKKVDLIAADMTPNPQRALQLNFTEPFYYGDIIAFATKDNPVSSWKDLNKSGIKIGVPLASSQVATVKKYLPNAEVVELSGGSPAVAQALSVGRVDAGVGQRDIAAPFTREFDNIRIVEGVISSSPFSFPTRPADTHLLEFLNNYFRVKKADGSIDALLDYWVRSKDWENDHLNK